MIYVLKKCIREKENSLKLLEVSFMNVNVQLREDEKVIKGFDFKHLRKNR